MNLRRLAILTLFPGLLIVGYVYAESQKPPPPTRQGEPWQTTTEASHKENINTGGRYDASHDMESTISDNGNAEHKKASAETGYQHDCKRQFWGVDNDPIVTYTRWLMIFTGALAISTIGLWVVTFFAGKDTKKAAESAQKSAEALPLIERAWVFIPVVEWANKSDKVLSGDGTGESIVSAYVFNAGKTPAIITILYAKAIVTETYPSLKNVHELSNIPMEDGFIIKADEKKWRRIKAKIHISTTQWTEIEQSTSLKLLCYGRIKYKDIFSRTHETGFCWEWTPDANGGRFQISDKADLNYYT
jgi:hypothetical protein